ncbi:MAG: hypothetical protein LAT62_04140 [Natronospirillum sp.]|uniref:DinB family protein n=1 Tax=Natronospirillum sp. TaxID=2812955 RepID=UPI0025E7AAA2|nr:DinB family protein [Natronospirillum sp.]MCH8551103.1 hypothetical protein [Natronospirillum sp.]
MASAHLKDLVAENKSLLVQLAGLLDRIPRTHYALAADGRQSIGRHLRHITDHYAAFLAAVEAPADFSLDYETRQRDPALETEPDKALQVIDALVDELDQLPEKCLQHPLRMCYPMAADPGSGEPATSIVEVPTCALRELVFLSSHTVHHMALIKPLAGKLKVRLPDSFGVHPSTLRHWAGMAPPLNCGAR